jgi:DNA-damage-inducible protein J
MTLAETIYQRSLKLPDAAAQEALDFIEFLNQRYALTEATTHAADGDAAAYDAWFKAQVQQAIDDPRPGIPADAAREHFAARRDALRQQGQAKG